MSGTEPKWTAEKILAAAVCLHTFALLFDLACPQSLYLPEISSPLTAAALLLRAIKGERIRTRCLLCAPALLLAAYIALDILSFLRGDLRAFAEKYRVAAVCALNAAGLYISLNDGALSPRGIYLTLCAAGMSAGIAALADRFLLNFSQTQYTMRITLRNDYNMYATVLLFAAIGGLGALLTCPPKPWRYTAFFASAAFLGGMAYLSGSRRILMAQLPVGLISIFTAVYSCTNRAEGRRAPSGGRDIRSLFAVTVSAAAFTLIAALAAPAVLGALERQSAPSGGAPSGETTLSERYDSLERAEDKDALGTRRVLWSAAIDEIAGMDTGELLFGRGGGYDIALYDRLLQSDGSVLGEAFGDGEKYLGKLSAHNFFLSDILCGGILRASVSAALWASLAIYALRSVSDSPLRKLPCAMLLAVPFLNSFISNRYGFLYDRCFWTAAVITIFTAQKSGRGDCENGRV